MAGNISPSPEVKKPVSVSFHDDPQRPRLCSVLTHHPQITESRILTISSSDLAVAVKNEITKSISGSIVALASTVALFFCRLIMLIAMMMMMMTMMMMMMIIMIMIMIMMRMLMIKMLERMMMMIFMIRIIMRMIMTTTMIDGD